ncbi:MAG: FHA domain-containing protein [Gemmataceae bacterium]|nr:FHA domain-containing protein [Gemmataceae bacterium]
MKVKLVVASGVHQGREIPIAGQEFVIGRDPQCQLRPSSPAISKKHCAIILRGNKVFVRDFGSTNGTFVNGEPVSGEVEVKNLAVLKAGPMDFRIGIESEEPVKVAPAAAAKPKTKAKEEDDDFAAFLLEGDTGPAPPVPEGSTIMEMGAIKPPGEGEKKPEPKKAAEADTRSAAADILKMYQRRPRT